MNFAWDELQTEIQSLAAQLFRDHASPDQLLAFEGGEQRLDPKLWEALREAGLSAIPLSEAAGGAGLGFQEAGLVFEQLGAHVAPVPLVGHTLAALALERSRGAEAVAGMVADEGWLACSARREGNTLEWEQGRLTGQLSGVAYGIGSRQVVVPARRGGEWALCLVNGADVDWQPQLSTGLEPQGMLRVEGVAAEMLGGEDLLRWLELRFDAAYSMAQVGVVSAALQLAREHVCERDQFGVKIGSFQAVAHRMADCWIDLMNLRLAAESAVVALDQEGDPALAVHTARTWSAEAGHRVLASVQHVHGGLGHDKDYPLWRYAVWSRQYEMLAGGLELALEDLGRSIASKPEAAFL